MAFVADSRTNPVGQEAIDRAFGDAVAAPKKDGINRDDYRITLPCFEGPLDLLLHLIRKDQLNIYDIPIAHILKTYLEHLDLMAQIDVNIAGEFMVMASTLMLIKSYVLLPKEGGDEEDPRIPLVAQLLEYEKFKKAADQIDARPWLYRDTFARPVTAASDLMPVETLMDGPIEPIDQFQFLLCLKISLDRTQRKPLQITTDPTSIRDKVNELTELLEKTEVIDFRSLLPEAPRAVDVVISFLAVLELAKLKFLEIIQTETFGPIQIRNVRSLRELNSGLLDQY
jgi:segregation and condensation protein A